MTHAEIITVDVLDWLRGRQWLVQSGFMPRAHAVLCDPPYFLGSISKRFGKPDSAPAKYGTDGVFQRQSRGFMGQSWDGFLSPWHYQAWVTEWAALLLDFVYPGAVGAFFGGTRTFHRLAAGLEDAGWEIADCIMWVYGAGFPKSLNISKSIDSAEQNYWLNISKAIDNLAVSGIIEAWKSYSENAKSADKISPLILKRESEIMSSANTARTPALMSDTSEPNHKSIPNASNNAKSAEKTFPKNLTETGTSTPENAFVLGSAQLSINLEESNASAILAELNLAAPPLSFAESFIVLWSADENEKQNPARFAENSLLNAQAKYMITGIVPLNARELENESITGKLKAVEALKTWLGNRQSSNGTDINALCVALTEDLKRIIFSRSKTFLSLDTNSQTAFASATTVIITESTAASLISFTADILRTEVLDKATRAERDVIGAIKKTPSAYSENMHPGWIRPWAEDHPKIMDITAPATPDAARFAGYGTALKPAWESILLARAPRHSATFAQLAREHGTGAINVDGSRIKTDDELKAGGNLRASPADNRNGKALGMFQPGTVNTYEQSTAGRWPANLILGCTCESDEHREDCAVRVLGEQSGETQSPVTYQRKADSGNVSAYSPGIGESAGAVSVNFGDSGTAARFFYCAKSSAWEREAGLHERAPQTVNDGRQTPIDNPYQRGETQRRNIHPTVKPITLTEYLARLLLPPTLSEPRRLLVPFAGVGSEMIGARLAGWDVVIGLERGAEYAAIGRQRLAWWAQFKSYDQAQAAYAADRDEAQTRASEAEAGVAQLPLFAEATP